MAERIAVNTETLNSYATRIQNVINRLGNLNTRIRKLYYTRKVTGIYSFVSSNRFYNGITILNSCRSYLTKTASDFETVENYFAKVNPLDFSEPANSLLQLANANDNISGSNSSVDGSSAALVGNSSKSMGESISDVLKEIGKVIKAGDKILSNDELGFGSSVWGFASDVVDYVFNTTTPTDAFTDGAGLVGSGLDVYNAFFQYLAKGSYGNDLELKFGEAFAGLAVIGSGIDMGLSGYESFEEYNKWKNGDASVYDFSSSIVDTLGEAVQFSGKAAMFYNWSTPGQVQILADGTITSGLVKNAEYLKNGAAYLKVADSTFTFFSTAVDSYGQYSSDGSVDMGDWGNIGVESSLRALNKLNPFGFLISDEAIDGVADFLIEDFGGAAANNLAQYDWYWDYASFDGNTLTNNVVTRGIAGAGATVIAMGETVCDGINYAFDAVSDAAADAAGWVVDGIAGLFK